MNLIIVGGEKLVYFLSRLFISKGYEITIINKDWEESSRLARMLKATIVHGDGSNPQILEEAGANSAEVLLAVTPHDQDNLLICQLAIRRFHIPHTLALVNDPDNEAVFLELGISSVFSTTRILASLIEQKTVYEGITNLIPLEEGKINVTEIILEEGSPVIEKQLKEIGLPENSLIASIIRKGQPLVPRGSTILKPGDRLIAVSFPDNLGQVLKILTGEQKAGES
jgi:trk system potassium uptake protein TrkA